MKAKTKTTTKAAPRKPGKPKTTRTKPEPCPFCGAAGEKEILPFTTRHGKYAFAGCSNKSCAVQPFAYDPDLEKAVAKWNVRAETKGGTSK